MKAVVVMCLGGAGAAVVLSWFYSRLPSTRLVVAVNSVSCAVLGALAGCPHSHSVLTPLAVGFVATSAPLTSVFLSFPAIETRSEAIRFAGHVGAILALNLLYGAAFAMVGFLIVLRISVPPLR